MDESDQGEVLVDETFLNDSFDSRLQWFSPPANFRIVQPQSGGGLEISPDSKKDFWRDTYYTPLLRKDDGHFLYLPVDVNDDVVVQARFTLFPRHQFDQAGLMARLDQDHWLKTGIEYVDGSARLSCVVTNVCSDWSTQEYQKHNNNNKTEQQQDPNQGRSEDEYNLQIQFHKIGNDLVVEYFNKPNEKWEFIRITRLQYDPNQLPDNLKVFKVGLFCCSPTLSGGRAVFHHFSIRKSKKGYHHKA